MGILIGTPLVAASSYAHGDSYTANGTGFGAGQTPRLYDDFSGGSNGSLVSTNSAVVGGWDSGTGHDKPVYSNLVSRSGGLSARHDYRAPNSYNQSLCQNFTITNLYLDWWMHVKVLENDLPSRNWKPWRLYGLGDSQDKMQLFCDWACNHALNMNYQDIGYFNDVDWNVGIAMPGTGDWIHWQIMVKLHPTNVNLDELIIYINHSSIDSIRPGTPPPLRNSTGHYYNQVRIGHYLDRSAYTPCAASDGADVFIDNVSISETWARVEIGNNATYGSCTVREIQRVTSWSDSTVNVVINTGLLTGDNTLFVIDEDNNVVQSETITLA